MTKINELKKEDGNLYAIYGTPAENLCGLQVKSSSARNTVSLKMYLTVNMSATVFIVMSQKISHRSRSRIWNIVSGNFPMVERSSM